MVSFDEHSQEPILHGMKKSPGRGAVGIFPKPFGSSRPGSKRSTVSNTRSPSMPGN